MELQVEGNIAQVEGNIRVADCQALNHAQKLSLSEGRNGGCALKNKEDDGAARSCRGAAIENGTHSRCVSHVAAGLHSAGLHAGPKGRAAPSKPIE